MFDFTKEEKKVILFLMAVAVLGLGINFTLKVNAQIKRVVKPQADIVMIDINKVAPEELFSHKIISKHLAQNIIEYRNTYGPFKRLEDLKKVKGIGDYRLSKLKEIFIVE